MKTREDTMCPTTADLAELIDGVVTKEKKFELTEHLAQCAKCYHAVSETIHLELEEKTNPPLHLFSKRVVIGSLAAAAVLLFLLRAPISSWVGQFARPSTFAVADLTETRSSGDELRRQLGSGWSEVSWPSMRGGGESAGAVDAAAFRLGVRVVDLQYAVLCEEVELSDALAAEIARMLEGTPFSEPIRSYYQDLGTFVSTGDFVEARERAVAGDSLLAVHFQNPFYSMGKWAEAGRIAAKIHDEAYFKSVSLDEANEAFGEIGSLSNEFARIRDLMHSTPIDLVALEDEFTNIVRSR